MIALAGTNLLVRDSLASLGALLITAILYALYIGLETWVKFNKTDKELLESKIDDIENQISTLKSIITLKR
jgi:hypothetical protein